jgi:uncharacterized membrane protein
MSAKKNLLNVALAGMFSLSTSAMAHDGHSHDNAMGVAPKGKEKCMGVAKKGKNDCGTDTHSCAGQAKKNYDDTEWKYVKKGTCKKIQEKIAKKKKSS